MREDINKMDIAVGLYRAYPSHSGKYWVLQVRTKARGLAGALGADSQWSYAGELFKSERAARNRVVALNRVNRR